MNIQTLLNLLIVIAIELPVFVLFFKQEWLTAVHFTVVLNAVTFATGSLLITRLGWDYYPVQLLLFVLETLVVYFFWNVPAKKAFLISLIANGLSFGFFEVFNKYFPT